MCTSGRHDERARSLLRTHPSGAQLRRGTCSCQPSLPNRFWTPVATQRPMVCACRLVRPDYKRPVIRACKPTLLRTASRTPRRRDCGTRNKGHLCHRRLRAYRLLASQRGNSCRLARNTHLESADRPRNRGTFERSVSALVLLSVKTILHYLREQTLAREKWNYGQAVYHRRGLSPISV